MVKFVAFWFFSKLNVLGSNPSKNIKIFKTGEQKVHKTQGSSSAAIVQYIKNRVIEISLSLPSIWNKVILLVYGTDSSVHKVGWAIRNYSVTRISKINSH